MFAHHDFQNCRYSASVCLVCREMAPAAREYSSVWGVRYGAGPCGCIQLESPGVGDMRNREVVNKAAQATDGQFTYSWITVIQEIRQGR